MIDEGFTAILQWGRRWKTTPWWPSDTPDACQQSLLRLLSVAISERLDVALMVQNFACEQRGRFRRRLQRMAKRLAEGMSLIDALEQTPDVLRDDTVLAIRFATQNGTLPKTLRRLALESDDSRGRRQTYLRQLLVYLSLLAFVSTLVLAMLLFNTFPMLQKVAEETNLSGAPQSLPASFVLLQSFGTVLGNASPWIALVFVLAIVVIKTPLAGMIRRSFRRRFPISIAADRNAELLILLADNADAGRSLSSGLSTLARYHFDSRMRHRLLLVRNEVEQGADAWDSMAAADLITEREAKAIASLDSASSIAWTLRRLGLWKADRLDRRDDKLIALIHPTFVFIAAAVVTLMGVAFFQLMTQVMSFASHPGIR
ncbi:type IV pilin biogenesis protein [Novipirellula galeiformis]|uniref:Type IV pilin biogenesis protein n=1 Tax=Novipirellula galeiformis TaxID=2528004 RepID=A0A5C6CJB4_9BACT|nr:type II secretion system F family protein [Novipirellula galeiformis]TWU24933.1 type IV pilin biogenesis protein [Novipirellula galeiformis]